MEIPQGLRTRSPQWFALSDAVTGERLGVDTHPRMLEVTVTAGETIREGERVTFSEDGRVWRDP